MNCENILFEYKTQVKTIILLQIKSILIGFSPVYFLFLSGMFFRALKISDLFSIDSNFLLLCSLLFIIGLGLIIFLFISFAGLNNYVFTDKQIKISNNFSKKNNKEILYSDIKYFTSSPLSKQILLKTTTGYCQIICNKENNHKIVEILNSKISDLSETEKQQKKINALDKPKNMILIVIIGGIFAFSIIPVTSFFRTKNADRHLQEFVKSNYTDKNSLDKAYNSYFATMNNKAFYNYKQMLKIEKYTKNEKFNENADYVKSLFPDKTKEIEDIINSEKVDFLN